MNIVLLVVAEGVKFDPAPSAGINSFAVGCEIECDLNKTAIVLESDVEPHSDCRASSHHLASHGPVGYAAHDPIGEQLPPDSDRRQRRIAAQIIDYGQIYCFLDCPPRPPARRAPVICLGRFFESDAEKQPSTKQDRIDKVQALY